MKFTSRFVNKASNWLIFVKGPIRGFVYKPTCEFQYELLNFTTKLGTKFATFTEKLCEINCNACQLDSVAQLVRAIHRNRRAADSIPAPIVAFFIAAHG